MDETTQDRDANLSPGTSVRDGSAPGSLELVALR